MFQNPFRKFFSYYSSCEDELGVHTCDPCNQDREFARVRSVAIIAKDYLSTLITADPTLAATWQAGITAGKIIIIPDTAGSFDPGDPKELKGYGNTKNSNGPREQVLTYFDPNYRDNYAFYNSITNISSKVIAYRTSSLIHIADVTASIVAKDPVADDLEEELTWQVTCKWTSINLPALHDATLLTGIFKCNG
jgi:hypothetical protein